MLGGVVQLQVQDSLLEWLLLVELELVLKDAVQGFYGDVGAVLDVWQESEAMTSTAVHQGAHEMRGNLPVAIVVFAVKVVVRTAEG